ncbi:hypothetical protein DNL40_06340 [Xylanimonas oleitrophica]|uniref:Uncharacterized protein n=1 Tax=Xylanimonas oleitrophica TaxID=2607479 RepID=A0A2W5WQ80_9MICO|nr:hypothetical protein [Xylanimonas oleitrophica]PZR53739.1 hypothetical protein DNL40_06340 [Xylanimonas oleitrophica]
MTLLDTAFAPAPPGEPLPPGPRHNDWPGEPAGAGAPVAALVHLLWRARGRHVRDDGTPTSVPRRAVPSAGGTYPVQWHVVVPPGAREQLPPGRYVYDPAREELVRRAPAPATGHHVVLVLTVQPGRTFGRYQHRSWPLWVADTAYALEAVRALVPDAVLPSDWSSMPAARHLVGVPAARDTTWWLDRGLVPEIALARIELPPAWERDARAVAGLEARRSPDRARFLARRPACAAAVAQAAEAARQSGQAWVLGADRVLTWARPGRVCAAAYPHLWNVHRQAARLTYHLARAGHAARAVSGFTEEPSAGAAPLLHAVAVLRGTAP